MKVLLIHPKCKTEEISHLQIPLGLCYIASYIRKKHDVMIYDEPVEKKSLKKLIDNFNPDVIGFSFTTQSAYRAYQLVKKFKKNKLCVAGGIHSTFRPEEALENGFDVVVLGEGERTFLKILDALELKKKIEIIRGIAYRKNGIVTKTKPYKMIKNLDKIPLPSWDLLDMAKYEQGAITTSRGCPFNCAYCASKKYYNRTFRQRSIKNVFKELKIIVNKHNQKLVQFFDDTFTVNHKFVKDFCKLIIDSKLKFTWSVQARVDTIQNDFEMLELLKKAGCKLIIFGIESGSEKILKRINKNITIQQMEDAINLTKKAKIDVKTTWIVGLPGNFSEQIESLDLMKRLKPNQITIHLCVPYFGTDLYEKRKEFGIWINDKVKSKDLYNFNPSYYENNDLNKFFKYSYISFGDIFKIAKKMKSEMRKVGYISPDRYKSGDEKTIKTFLDKVKNPLIKEY